MNVSTSPITAVTTPTQNRMRPAALMSKPSALAVTAQYMIAPTTPSTMPSTRMLVPVVRLIWSSFRGLGRVYPGRSGPNPAVRRRGEQGRRVLMSQQQHRVVVVPVDDRVIGPATPGMERQQALATEGLWAGFVRTRPGMMSGWHHHGEFDTAVYVLSGAIRFEWDRPTTTSPTPVPGTSCWCRS